MQMHFTYLIFLGSIPNHTHVPINLLECSMPKENKRKKKKKPLQSSIRPPKKREEVPRGTASLAKWDHLVISHQKKMYDYVARLIHWLNYVHGKDTNMVSRVEWGERMCYIWCGGSIRYCGLLLFLFLIHLPFTTLCFLKLMRMEHCRRGWRSFLGGEF